jgi:hypothetical protein
VENGVGILPICGPIGSNLSPIEKMLGGCDVADISASFDAFAVDPSVRTLLLDVDSPGGTVTGVPELAAQIAAFPKPTLAFTSGEACSAAYWLASQADDFLATPSASVGSVGVYLALLDSSAALARSGLFVDVIKAGTYKAAGFPGTSLSEEQRALLQERVDMVHRMFMGAIVLRNAGGGTWACHGHRAESRRNARPVDNSAGGIAMTLEEKLSAAETKLTEAETLLTSERAAAEALRQQLAAAETAKAEESALNAELGNQLKAARKESADLAARITQLEAASKTAEAKAAEICASVGVTPLAVTAQGDAVATTPTDLVEELRKQETPAAQTAFWRKNKSKILSR